MYGTAYAPAVEKERKKPARKAAPVLGLLDMGVAADVVLTVAVVSLTPGAVTKFQLRVGHIGASADRTFVGVRRLWRCLLLLAAGNGARGRGTSEHPFFAVQKATRILKNSHLYNL